ncbi:MAG: FAD:protein FMN transferase [FCB group bacterium]|nr:FAD:protein FMN transferase [FCB group bacterium]
MRKSVTIVLLLSLLLFSACSKTVEPFRSQKLVLGTAVTISIFDKGSLDDVNAELETVFNEMSVFDELWAANGDDSDIKLLRENAGKVSQDLDPRTFKLLADGVKLETETEGYFNLRMGPVTGLWGFHQQKRYVPSAQEINDKIHLIEGGMFFAGNSCLLGIEGMSLDIGGIGKGFAVDLAVDQLINDGAKAGIVEAGGDLQVFGLPEPGKPWKIGIRHPRNLEEFYAVLEIESGAVATSGDYQQYFIAEGIRFHHIIDPATGLPANKCVSATVTAKSCIEADAAATAVFVMGPEKGMAWLNEHQDYSGLIVYYDENDNLTHVYSPELKMSFNP